jgi:hypothetical protein
MRTGSLVLEMITPAAFETAVVFRRPRWPRLNTEHRVIQYALRALERQAGEQPVITEHGRRLEWRMAGPRRGDRYICVVFHAHGVAQWQDRLKSMSLVGRLRALMRPLLPA